MTRKKSLEALLIGLLVLSITGGIVFTTMSLGAKGQQAPRKSNNLTISQGEDNNEELEEGMEDENSSRGVASSGNLQDGEYEGTARGYSSDITVRVIIRAGKIFDIEVLSQAETPEYFQYALSVLDDIIDRNSTDVDSVSGATISSDALKEAVSIALEKAGSSEVSGRKSSRSNKSGKSNRRNGNVLNKNRQRVRNKRRFSRGSGNVPTEPRVRDNTPNEIIEDGMFKDGKYEGSAYGFKSYIKVLVTIEKGKISNVEILSHGEDYSYFSRAKSVVNAMIGGTSADVDSVSGATYSSNAIINAVNEALSKALVNPSRDSKEKEKIKPNAKVKPNPGGGRPSPRPNPSPSPGPSPGGSPRPDINKNIRLVDGSYEGSAYGYRSIIKVSVKVKDGKIASVEVLNHGEDYPYFGMARDVINRLIGRNNTDVDSVSRATYSSNGIIKAVRDALKNAIDNSPQEETPEEKPNPGEKPNPEENLTPGESEKTDPDEDIRKKNEKAIEEVLRKGQLKSGEYIGYGAGYNTTKGRIQTKLIVEDGKIKDIILLDDEKIYPDDWGIYKDTSRKVLNFFRDKDKGSRNLAIMKLYRDYVDQIANASDPKEKAKELIGEKYANRIQASTMEFISPVVRSYFAEKHGSRSMFDTVTGATLSAGGMARSVDDAIGKSESDAKTGSNIDFIRVVIDKDALIQKNIYTHKAELLSNKYEPLDLKELKIELVYKDGKSEEVSYKDFVKNNIEIITTDGMKIEDGMVLSDEIKNKIVLNTEIIHKDSNRKVELAIKFGNYSKDYISKMEYSLDKGKTWIDVINPKKADENKNNISDNQTIKIKKEFLGKSILIRTTTEKGTIFNYQSKDAIKFGRLKLDCVDNSYTHNNNASFAVYISIEEDKESRTNPEPQAPKEAQEVGAKDLDIIFTEKILNHSKIKDTAIKLGEGVSIRSIDNLPNGLKLQDNHIVGRMEILDDEFQEPYKEIEITLYGRKNGKNIKRNIKMPLYQDKDRDGVDDNEEGEKGANEFNALFKGTSYAEKILYKHIGDEEPTIEEYKSLFKNIPDDGSVTIKVIGKPNMNSTSGQTIARLQFISSHVSGVARPTAVGIKLSTTPKLDIKSQLTNAMHQPLIAKVAQNLSLTSEKPAMLYGSYKKNYANKMEYDFVGAKNLMEIENSDEYCIEVGAEVLDADFGEKILNYQELDSVEVKVKKGITDVDVYDLPEGLYYEDGKIQGQVYVDDDEFLDGISKEFEISIYGVQDGEDIVRIIKLVVYQDKNENGIAADEEGVELDNQFEQDFFIKSTKTELRDNSSSVEDHGDSMKFSDKKVKVLTTKNTRD